MGVTDKDHRFLDEAGDTTFFGKGRTLILDQEGASKAFILGMVKFRGNLEIYRNAVKDLELKIIQDPYFQDVPSIRKRVNKGGFHFHAKDDLPEIRMLFFKLIRGMECSLEAVVAQKIPPIFERKHHGKDAEFYADLLSHLLKNKLQLKVPLVLNVAERGTSTRQRVLDDALDKATRRFQAQRPDREVSAQVRFNVQTPRTEPLLAVADYLCWAVQRVFERGDLRPYHFVQEQIALVVDLYDQPKWQGSRNYYTQRNPLTAANHLPKYQGPPPP
jgi:hypothetical protein